MDSNILWIMLCTVGITELIKVFCNKIKDKWAAFVSVLVSIAISCLYLFVPKYWNVIRIALVATSGATVFYDTVFKMFKKLIEGDKSNDFEGTLSRYSDDLR